MKHKNGFTAVEGLIIVLVVAAIGFGGFTVWNNNQDDEPDTNEATQSQQDPAQSDSEPEATAEAPEDANTAPDEWKTYAGAGYSFTYPASWEGLDDLPDDWQPAVISDADGHEVGGGFGPLISYNADDSTWYIKKLGRFPGNRKVGDAFDLDNRTSASGVVVYDYTQGDGPYSSTTLLFVAGSKMVTIVLPDACSDECFTKSTYDRGEIFIFSEQISESVSVE